MQAICLILLVLIAKALGQSDFEVLLELKRGIEQDPDQVLRSWDSKALSSDGCPQNWAGITCSDGHVVSIALDNVGLVGNFSFPVIIGLKMLRNLSISNNHLMGTISSIGSMESLEFLDLSCNMFSGRLPPDMFDLRSLLLLNLSSNNFEGRVPSGLHNLEQLKYLDFRGNGFSGDIMEIFSQLGGVLQVDLSSNRFSGSLDLGLGNSSFISSVQYLNISRNSLVGEFFAHDGTPYFDKLEIFDASNNNLEGTIPLFSFVVSLRVLRLGNNQLSGSLPKDLLQESSMSLSELDLSLNQLQGPVESITSTTLSKLNLSSNKLSGALPAKVGHCAIIDLSNNMLSGNLSRIQNWGNYVEEIQLSSNSLRGNLPNLTSQFLRLASFKISNNSLDGVLPPVLGTYPELKVIDVSLNNLRGFLLPSFFTSTKLAVLNLSGNNFSGSIPLQGAQNIPLDSAGNLSLVSLDLSFNSLSGHLPPEIGRFRNLLYVNLCNNKFDGRIPDDLPDELVAFNVSSNNLSGVVPYNLRQFPDSAFHPGNSLLILLKSPVSADDAPHLNLKKHESHTKAALKIALIAGLVVIVAMLALLCIVISYRSHWLESKRESSKEDGQTKSISQEDSSLSHTSANNRNADPSISSFSFHQHHLPSLPTGPGYELGDTSTIVRKPKNLKGPESLRVAEGLSSPMSIFSSSNPSPSRNQLPIEHPGMLKVYSPDKLAGDLHLFDSSLLITSQELSVAPAEVIGRSCHGTLYKATLDSGDVLAVKWLKEGIAKRRKEFAREVKKLGNIKHPNLVSLLGYYWGPKEHEKLVISNFIDGHCLALYLQETEPWRLPPLSLDERFKVAMDVAQCLNYLHNERAIPHGNLKSSNILLESSSMNVLITDYSLHRILTPAGTAEQVLNAGALGYRPPEFASSSKPCPSLKSDVYAFGVILLELLTAKNPGEIVSGHPGIVELTDWVWLLVEENRTGECFDRHIAEHPPRVLNDMLQVALKCILPASERPDMKSVFENLSMIVL